jgi:ABC-2 type transport system permease protein
MSDASKDSEQFPLDQHLAAPRISRATRPFFWSVRRELWESRSIYIAPLVVAGVFLFGFLISVIRLSARAMNGSTDALSMHSVSLITPIPYAVAGVAIALTTILVAVFYCLGALHNERRDRSILFWKSLPVSDLTAVLAKASIPMVVLPVVAFVIVVVLQIIMMVLNTGSLLVRGLSPTMFWSELPLLRMQVVAFYTFVVTALWFAPVYAWLLLVSGWARRAPFLWAVLPPLALALLEKIAFNSSYVGSLLSYRLHGFSDAFTNGAFSQSNNSSGVLDPLSILDPVGFLETPGLWTGLVAAAALTAAAIWFRRRREPI